MEAKARELGLHIVIDAQERVMGHFAYDSDWLGDLPRDSCLSVLFWSGSYSNEELAEHMMSWYIRAIETNSVLFVSYGTEADRYNISAIIPGRFGIVQGDGIIAHKNPVADLIDPVYERIEECEKRLDDLCRFARAISPAAKNPRVDS